VTLVVSPRCRSRTALALLSCRALPARSVTWPSARGVSSAPAGRRPPCPLSSAPAHTSRREFGIALTPQSPRAASTTREKWTPSAGCRRDRRSALTWTCSGTGCPDQWPLRSDQADRWGRPTLEHVSNADSNGPARPIGRLNLTRRNGRSAPLSWTAEPSGTVRRPRAEGVGFEPTVGCPTHAFQACRFGRSRIPPRGHRSAGAELVGREAERWDPEPYRLSCATPVIAGGGRVLCNCSP
jgi:hypothetical protein